VLTALNRTFTQLDYLLKETLTGFQRAGWLNTAAVSVLLILLYLFGLGWQGVWQVERGLAVLGAQLEVAVYLKPTARGADLVGQAQQLTGVTAVELITRDQALQILQQEVGLQKDLTGIIGENPLVDVLHLQIATPEQVQLVATVVQGWQSVESVRYGSEAAQRLGQLKAVVSWFGLLLLGLLAVAAVMVVTTTIGLVVTSRQREIEVMQLVGAAPHWVYLPFMLEGLILGILGAVFAYSLLTFTGNFVYQQTLAYLPFITFTDAAPTPWHLPVILGGTGMVLGCLGSWLAVLRYSKQ